MTMIWKPEPIPVLGAVGRQLPVGGEQSARFKCSASAGDCSAAVARLLPVGFSERTNASRHQAVVRHDDPVHGRMATVRSAAAAGLSRAGPRRAGDRCPPARNRSADPREPVASFGAD